MPAVYAMRARRYMHETGATARHLAMIAVKAHEYGARNPNAQFQNRITVDDVMALAHGGRPAHALHVLPDRRRRRRRRS